MAKLFSDREIRAIAVFLPLAGLLIIALMLVRPCLLYTSDAADE